MQNKKIIIILIAILATIAVVSVIGYSWYNGEFDDNIKKASGYQKISLKTMNDDFANEWHIINPFTNVELLKNKVPALQNYLDEFKDSVKNTEIYLNNAKKSAKNDAEKEYIGLLLKKNEGNKDLIKTKQERLNALKEYTNGEISFSEFSAKLLDIDKREINIGSNARTVNNNISRLLIDNPGLKQHLIELDVDKTYLGENPSK